MLYTLHYNTAYAKNEALTRLSPCLTKISFPTLPLTPLFDLENLGTFNFKGLTKAKRDATRKTCRKTPRQEALEPPPGRDILTLNSIRNRRRGASIRNSVCRRVLFVSKEF